MGVPRQCFGALNWLEGNTNFEREDGAAEGIFKGDESRRTVMRICGRNGVFLYIRKSQVMPIHRRNRQGQSPR